MAHKYNIWPTKDFYEGGFIISYVGFVLWLFSLSYSYILSVWNSTQYSKEVPTIIGMETTVSVKPVFGLFTELVVKVIQFAVFVPLQTKFFQTKDWSEFENNELKLEYAIE